MREGRPRRVVGVALFVLWLFAVSATFKVVQKPFAGQIARAVAWSAFDVATTTLVVGVGGSFGLV
jgi:hypothetical protein